MQQEFYLQLADTQEKYLNLLNSFNLIKQRYTS